MSNTRREKLIASFPENADAMLITTEKNQYYLTGFDYTDGVVLVTRNKSYVLADFRYIEAARNEVGEGFEVVQLKGRVTEIVKGLLADNGAKTMLYENNRMTCSSFDNWSRSLTEIEFIPAGTIIERLREYKDETEIENIIAAQRIAEKAFDHILGYINPDRTEKEIALELEYTMRKLGASGCSFDIIAVSGTASALPHGVPRGCKLENGFLTMDFGALYNGYCSDMTRTVCIGRADDEMKKIYDTVYQAQMAAIEVVLPGNKCADADQKARKIIGDAGYGEYFGHGLGHGVGLDIHEAPSVSAGAGEKLLTEGHVVTVEPGIYLAGKYGVRIEDMVVIYKDRAVDITNCPKNLIEIM